MHELQHELAIKTSFAQPPRSRVARSALIAAWLGVPRALGAQAAAPAHPETGLAGFKLSGFVEASYAYSGRSSGDTAIVGRLYDRFQDHFMLNALALVLDKPYDATKFSAGFHTEVLLG